MTLAAGSRLGPYEIISPLGSGGMGEVYRARDTRLDRDVAIKVLPERFARDPEALARFEREAKAVAALSHPNILGIFDFGREGDIVFAVMELLRGESLRGALSSGPLAPRRATDYGARIARGLAAAHERGIVHRDLKPENIFVTDDDEVKILDFGLAKQRPLEPADTQSPTQAAGTEPGTILGTVGYMSPEQVRGQNADHRSDIFSFGAVLYEMVTGLRAFRGESAVETMNAILEKEPPEAETSAAVAQGLDRITRRCLEKRPERRFQSASDLAFALENRGPVSGTSSSAQVPTRRPSPELWRTVALASALALGAAAAVGAFFIGKRAGFRPPPSYRQQTFRRGFIRSARFAPDGQTYVYGAAWEGKPIEIYTARLNVAEARPLGLPGAVPLSISSSGELLLLNRFLYGKGTLAQMPLSGGAPRELLDDVRFADWAPDGQRILDVRSAGNVNRLEFPLGKTIDASNPRFEFPRISPRGDQIAFIAYWRDHAFIKTSSLTGSERNYGGSWAEAAGLAWEPGGGEVWFTGTPMNWIELGLDSGPGLYALKRHGAVRLLTRVAGNMILHDISRDGKALMTRESLRFGIVGVFPGDPRERELSWFDRSHIRDLFPDGKMILFEDYESPQYRPAVFLRPTDGGPAVRLGEGRAESLSPDGKWVLSLPDVAVTHESQPKVVLLPVGSGQPKTLPPGKIERYSRAIWLPNGRQIAFAGNSHAAPTRLYLQDLDGTGPRPITENGVTLHDDAVAISPDGRFIAARQADKYALYPLAGGAPKPLPGLMPGDRPIAFTADGSTLYAVNGNAPELYPSTIVRIALGTGRRESVRDIAPPDRAGLVDIDSVFITPDGKHYAYSYKRLLSELYLVEGLR